MKIKFLDNINKWMKNYSPLLHIIELVGVGVAITFTIITYCNTNHSDEKLTASLYALWPYGHYMDKNAISVDLVFTNQGSTVCVISNVMLFSDEIIEKDKPPIPGFMFYGIDSSLNSTPESIILQPKQVVKKRYLFPYTKLAWAYIEGGDSTPNKYQAKAEIDIWAIDSKGNKHGNSIDNIFFDVENKGISGMNISGAKNQIILINNK